MFCASQFSLCVRLVGARERSERVALRRQPRRQLKAAACLYLSAHTAAIVKFTGAENKVNQLKLIMLKSKYSLQFDNSHH